MFAMTIRALHPSEMTQTFVNRTAELAELDSMSKTGGLIVVFGRRRVGKTRLLSQWLSQNKGRYSQAIEGSPGTQLEQVFRDIQEHLRTDVVPKSWFELFELLALEVQPTVLCLDEFPYLVAADPSLPSVLQRWFDHKRPKKFTLILAGSSTAMMNDIFLNRAAPLYGRARKLLHVEPMSYGAFCKGLRLPTEDMESFTRFSLVGGIPKYWEFVRPKTSAIELANELFFGFAPYLDQEPARVLRDEGITGMNAISLLEVIGRGASKPSEMAARLQTPQTNLSRLLQQLLDASVLRRELPFGESSRSTKRTRYVIADPTLRFWFGVYSPHRTRWTRYTKAERNKLLHDHASTVFEDYCRNVHPEAARYWESGLEFDAVRIEPGPAKTSVAVVTEVKWTRLSPAERTRLAAAVADKWSRCTLNHKWLAPRIEILDATHLKQLARF